MKLTILGGGGFRVPLVYRALLARSGEPRVGEVALYDPCRERLAVIATVLAQLAAGRADPPRFSATTELETALEGTDFVFSAVRVGGLAGRARDERVALDQGVLGQETTGAGGIAFGLRTIPVLLELAERVKSVAPEAYFINFTNPAGMVTEALRPVLGDRVIGICDTPGGLSRRAASALGADPARTQVDYVGLNHLGWLRRLIVDGHDRLPTLLSDEVALAGLEEGQIFGPSWLRELGCLPNEYLYYYYHQREAVRSIGEQAATRGEFLGRQQGSFYAEAGRDPDHALGRWRRTIAEREALYMAEAKAEAPDPAGGPETDAEASDGGYEAVALAVMAAIAGNERSTMVVNVANRGTVRGLPDDAVIEVPSLLDANGAHPLSTAAPDLHQIGLMQQVKAVERLVIEAATTGSPEAAVRAFALHPLVDSVSVARSLLREYREAIPEVARVFGRDG